MEYVESDEDDAELLFYIPFTQTVRIKSVCFANATNDAESDSTKSPSRVSLYVNRENNVDFGSIQDAPEAQLIECVGPDFDASVFYPLSQRLFSNVIGLHVYVRGNLSSDEESQTRISYLGFKGEATGGMRRAVEAIYEKAANPADHKLKTGAKDGAVM